MEGKNIKVVSFLILAGFVFTCISIFASSGEKNEPRTVTLRENMQFFSDLKCKQLKNYETSPRDMDRPLEQAFFQKPGGIGNSDYREVREEFQRTQDRMNQITREISDSAAQLASMLSGVSNSPDARRRNPEEQLRAARINQLQNRILSLRQQQNRFVQRLYELRNAMN